MLFKKESVSILKVVSDVAGKRKNSKIYIRSYSGQPISVTQDQHWSICSKNAHLLFHRLEEYYVCMNLQV